MNKPTKLFTVNKISAQFLSANKSNRSDVADQLEADFGTLILEDLTDDTLTHKGQPVRLFDQTLKTAEVYYPADEKGKPYIQNYQEGKRWYPITAYCEAFQVDWKTAVQQLERKYIGGSTSSVYSRGHRVQSTGSTVSKPPASFHDPAFVNQTQANYERNNFAIYLRRLFGIPVADELLTRFRVGTWPGGVAREWQRCTVYWQIDELEQIHAGKVMYYHQGTGKRIKDECRDFAMPSWAHKLIGIPDFHLDQCLFGLHQLRESTEAKPIALVESEKSAIICTAFEPGFFWMATGGLSQLSVDKFAPLRGRKIVLFPDLGGFTKWSQKGEDLTRLGYNVTISSVLEVRASSLERHAGYDLADFLTRHRCDTTGRALTEVEGYPALWDCEPLNQEPIGKMLTLKDYMNQVDN